MSRDGRRGAPGRLLADDRGDRQMTTSAMSLTPPLPSAFQLASDEVHSWCASLDVPPETSARLYATLTPDERTRSASDAPRGARALSTPFHKYDPVCCVDFRFWRGATREHPPKWGCDRGATKPEPKSEATLRATVLFGPDVVAHSLADPGRLCASLAPRLGQKSLVANVAVFMKWGTKDSCQNRRKRRSRRGHQAEVFFAPKSAASRRRLPFLNV